MLAEQLIFTADLLKRAEGIQKRISTLLKRLSPLRDMDGVAFPTLAKRNSDALALLEVLAEGRRSIALLLAMDFDKETTVTDENLEALDQAINSINNEVEQIHSTTNAVLELKEPYRIDNGLQIVLANGEVVIDFSGVTRNMWRSVQILMNTISRLQYVLRDAPRKAASGRQQDLAQEVLVVQEGLERISEAVRRLKRSEREISEILNQAAMARSEAQQLVEELSRASEEKLNSVDSVAARATATVAEIAGQAATISSRVEEVQRISAGAEVANMELLKFSAELAAARKRLQAAEEAAGSLKADLETKQGQISQMITGAEAMVSGATVAGLATAFSEEKRSLEKSMTWAFIGFGVGIIFLALTTVGLAVYVLEVPITIFGVKVAAEGATPKVGDETTISGVLSRAIILLAPFWLTLFSARRYQKLFDLRQQYSHKYNMAFSMDGFKRQAPTYSEQIAAWVFQVVSANPLPGGSSKGMDESPTNSIKELADGVVDRLASVLKKSP